MRRLAPSTKLAQLPIEPIRIVDAPTRQHLELNAHLKSFKQKLKEMLSWVILNQLRAHLN